MTPSDQTQLDTQLQRLHLHHIKSHYQAAATRAAEQQCPYLPIDKHGADLLFQIISQRYERAPMVLTTNRAYKHWSQIFNNDSTLTSAILDRVLHHVDTVIIEGKSFRTKEGIEE